MSTTPRRFSLMRTPAHPNRKLTVLRVSEDPSRLHEYLLVGGLPNAAYRDYKNKFNHALAYISYHVFTVHRR